MPIEGWHINTVTPDVGTLQDSLNTHLAQQSALAPTTVRHSRHQGRPASIVLVSENDPELLLKFASNRKAYQHMGMAKSQFKAMRADDTAVNGWRVKKMDAQRHVTRFNHGKPHTATATPVYIERHPLQQTPSQMPFDDVSATQRQLQAPQQARNRVPSGGQVHTVNTPVVSEELDMQPCALYQAPSAKVRTPNLEQSALPPLLHPSTKEGVLRDTLKPVVVVRIPKAAVPKGRTGAQASIRLSAKLRADDTLVKANHRQNPVTVYASPQTGSSHPRKKSAKSAAKPVYASPQPNSSHPRKKSATAAAKPVYAPPQPGQFQHKTFDEAVKFARTLNLRNTKEWRAWSQRGARPPDVPYNPNRTYKDKGWKGLGYWLGTGDHAGKPVGKPVGKASKPRTKPSAS